MKTKVRLIIISAVSVLCVLILIRIFSSSPGGSQDNWISPEVDFAPSQNASSFEVGRKNYASTKLEYKDNQTNQTTEVDQKYEKIADLYAGTSKFEEDEKQLRGIIKQYEALIQFEQNSGQVGSRYLQLAIGVNPKYFDSIISDIKKVGLLAAIQINKTDKTNEFRTLTAQRISLDKTIASLNALKQRGASVSELIELENRLLDLESQIQALGVSLGDYDAENEFCTVKYVLSETQTPAKRSIADRLKDSIEWVLTYFALFVVVAVFMILGAYLVVALADKILKIVKTVKETPTQPNP